MDIHSLWNKVRRFISFAFNSCNGLGSRIKGVYSRKRRSTDNAGTEHPLKYKRKNNNLPVDVPPLPDAYDENNSIPSASIIARDRYVDIRRRRPHSEPISPRPGMRATRSPQLLRSHLSLPTFSETLQSYHEQSIFNSESSINRLSCRAFPSESARRNSSNLSIGSNASILNYDNDLKERASYINFLNNCVSNTNISDAYPYQNSRTFFLSTNNILPGETSGDHTALSDGFDRSRSSGDMQTGLGELPSNTLKRCYGISDLLRADWEQVYTQRYEGSIENHNHQRNSIEAELDRVVERHWAIESDMTHRANDTELLESIMGELSLNDEPTEEVAGVSTTITDEQRQRISEALSKSKNYVLIVVCNKHFRRKDLNTLTPANWLNTEVVEVYLDLITERSEQRANILPSVYTMSSCFIPRLLNSGYIAIRRWTRKFNIFTKDIILMPVQSNGLHWSIVIIDFRVKSIRYYNSMNETNSILLKAIENFIRLEALDKYNETLNTSLYVIESVTDLTEPMNECDSGVFSCMFAEYITRDKSITFSKDNIEYFRYKMMLEILEGKLWNQN